MRIFLKKAQKVRAGRNRTDYSVGEYTDVDDALAQTWINAGIAVALDAPPAPEPEPEPEPEVEDTAPDDDDDSDPYTDPEPRF